MTGGGFFEIGLAASSSPEPRTLIQQLGAGGDIDAHHQTRSFTMA
jgi:hypothetical protein